MRRRAMVALAIVPLLAACGGAGPLARATPTATPAPGPTLTAPPTATGSASLPPTTPPPPSATATAAPPPSPAATVAPTATPYALPASLAGAEWYRLPTQDRVVALTFDAGSNNAGVASILATLSAQHVPATFFLTGRFAELFPADARRIAAQYSVGDHTYAHPHLPQLSDAEVVDEVQSAQWAIQSATGEDPRPLFRFPYGDSDARTLDLVHGLGYGSIRWTVDTLGWKGRSGGQSVDTVVSRVLSAAAPGAMVLMHVGAADDGTTLDADALPQVISQLRARGYALVTVMQCVG